MKNAEMELVRVGGDVIMTSGGGSEEIWTNYNRILFWDYDEKPEGRLPIAAFIKPGKDLLPFNTYSSRAELLEAMTGKGYDSIEETNYSSVFINNKSLSELMDTVFTSDYNGVYKFKVENNITRTTDKLS